MLLRYSPRPSVNVDANGDPESFQNQLARCKALVDARQGTILAVREEPAVSGRRASRKVLDATVEECRRTGATLLVSSLDRMSRRVAFVATLMESGVPFVTADAPNDDPFMTHVRAAVSEDESKKISKRTRDAMLGMQNRGRLVGSEPPFGWKRGKSFEVVRGGAKLTRWMLAPDAGEQRVLARIRELGERVRSGKLTVYTAANILNDEGMPARRGKWVSNKLIRILERDQASGGRFEPVVGGE